MKASLAPWFILFFDNFPRDPCNISALICRFQNKADNEAVSHSEAVIRGTLTMIAATCYTNQCYTNQVVTHTRDRSRRRVDFQEYR